MMSEAFPMVFENRVRFAETDRQGVVFYGRFFTFLDEAVNAYFRTIGYPYSLMEANGWTTHVVHAELDFHVSVEFEDLIKNHLRFTSLGTSSMTAEYAARRADDGTDIATGTIVHVAVDLETDTPIEIPSEFSEAISAFQKHPPEMNG